MLISVSIVNYKVPELLSKCLESIQMALEGIEHEIIVVDNHSEDHSQSLIQSRFPNIIWIQNTENLGFGKAHNQALSRAQGQYFAIINPDVEVSKNTFEDLLKKSEKLVNWGIIGVQMLDEKGNFLPESKRNVPTLSNAFEKELSMSFLSKNKQYYAYQLQVNEDGKVPIISGAFMFIPQVVFWEMGGFDERFFMYAEDIDLSMQSLRLGYENYYLGSVVIRHIKGKSAAQNPEDRKHFYRAMKLFVNKYYKNPVVKWANTFFIELAYLKHSLSK